MGVFFGDGRLVVFVCGVGSGRVEGFVRGLVWIEFIGRGFWFFFDYR